MRVSSWCWCAIGRPPLLYLYLWAPLLERGILTHLFHQFICVRLIISVRRSLPLCECLWSPFLEREIFTHFIRLFICVCRLAVWRFRHTPFSPCVRLIISVRRSFHLCESLRPHFLEQEIFTHFIGLLICVCRLCV